MITFQSVVDATVSVDAIIAALYAHLPANGSELVLFDINRQAKFGLVLRPESAAALARLLPAEPRRYRTTVITNAGADTAEVIEQVTETGEVASRTRPTGLSYPFGVFSLSHVAVPFPVSDGLYGLEPDPGEDFGIRLGALALRGERGVLITSQESLTRLQSNPFFPYLLERIDEGIGPLRRDRDIVMTLAARARPGGVPALAPGGDRKSLVRDPARPARADASRRVTRARDIGTRHTHVLAAGPASERRLPRSERRPAGAARAPVPCAAYLPTRAGNCWKMSRTAESSAGPMFPPCCA